MIRYAISRTRPLAFAGCLAGLGALSAVAADKPLQLVYSGLGWVQYGIVAHSTDTVNNNYNGNTIQSTGAQLSLSAQISDHLNGRAGLGVLETQTMAGGISGGGKVPTAVTPYIAEASFTYTFWDAEKSSFKLTGGLFPFDYNPDVKNLGLYLLRGPVYPGVVVSGFETKHVLPIANMLGFQLHHQTGGFKQDLLINSENELHPYFDISPAYIASYEFGKAFRIGAGVNFYHLLPVAKYLDAPPKDSAFLAARKETPEINVKSDYDRVMIYVDTTGGRRDTTVLGFQGTKLMGNFSVDPKEFFGGIGIMGAEDLKLYGELAVIGLNTSKAYKALYGDLKNRMPMMIGFNIPMFRILDHLSLEVEWYGAKFRDDYTRYQPARSYFESPIPVSNSFFHRNKETRIDPKTGVPTDYLSGTDTPFSEVDLEKNITSDNYKWSLHGSKIIQDHFRISFQVANDHFRPGGTGTQDTPTWEAIFSSTKDWYWMSKVSYFF